MRSEEEIREKLHDYYIAQTTALKTGATFEPAILDHILSLLSWVLGEEGR